MLSRPMSSPQMTRMFGFFCCASAGPQRRAASTKTRILANVFFMTSFLGSSRFLAGCVYRFAELVRTDPALLRVGEQP